MKKLLFLLLLSFNIHAQTIEQFKRSTLKMIAGRECEINLQLADSQIAICDSINKSYESKLNQANTLIQIHKSVESGQAKQMDKLSGQVATETRRKRFWRKSTITLGGIDIILIGWGYYRIKNKLNKQL